MVIKIFGICKLPPLKFRARSFNFFTMKTSKISLEFLTRRTLRSQRTPRDALDSQTARFLSCFFLGFYKKACRIRPAYKLPKYLCGLCVLCEKKIRKSLSACFFCVLCEIFSEYYCKIRCPECK
jgi:hypothetical protein